MVVYELRIGRKTARVIAGRRSGSDDKEAEADDSKKEGSIAGGTYRPRRFRWKSRNLAGRTPRGLWDKTL